MNNDQWIEELQKYVEQEWPLESTTLSTTECRSNDKRLLVLLECSSTYNIFIEYHYKEYFILSNSSNNRISVIFCHPNLNNIVSDIEKEVVLRIIEKFKDILAKRELIK